MSFMKRDRGSYKDAAVPEPTQSPPASSPVSSAADILAASPVATVKAPAAEASSAPPPLNREAAAVVDKKSEIKGTLHTQGNLLVEGCFQGEIEAKETVWIEKGAQTEAQLRANDVIVSGTFDGEIDCRHRLQIADSAVISGEIKTPVLVIAEGATVNCRFSMTRAGGKGK